MTLHSACAVARPYAARSTKHAATDDTITIACLPGLTGYAGGKISACCLVFVIMKSYIAYFIETGYPTIAVTVKCLDPVPWMPGLGVWTPRTILAMATACLVRSRAINVQRDSGLLARSLAGASVRPRVRFHFRDFIESRWPATKTTTTMTTRQTF